MNRTLGLAYLVAGAAVHYGLLNVLGLRSTAPLTGGVFAAAGLMSLLPLWRRWRPNRYDLGLLSIGIAFWAWWYAQWELDPPRILYFADYQSRILISAAAFGVIPFLCGVALRSDDVNGLARAAGLMGVASTLVVCVYWINDRSSGVWEVFPELSGLYLEATLGLGCLAFLIAFPERRLACAAVLLATVAIDVRVGERGPLVFLAPAVLLIFLRRRSQGVAARLIGAGIILAGAAAIAVTMAERYQVDRVVVAENYNADHNSNRLGILSDAIQAVLESPFTGRGGSLTGRRLGSGYVWQYAHNWWLDSLVETGIVGALLHWSITVLAVLRMITARSPLLPLLFYALAEQQVSGHVSSARALWLLIGIGCSQSAGGTATDPGVAHPAERRSTLAISRVVGR